MTQRILTATAAIAVALATSRVASGQQRPLPIEMPEGAGAGNMSLQAAFDYTRDARFPLSGLQGQLWRIGLLRIDVGLSDIATIDLGGGLRDHLAISSRTPAALSDALQLADPNSTSAFDDVVIGTKIRLLAARSASSFLSSSDDPSQSRGGLSGLDLAVHVATRLPNAKHPSGLGQDSTDFFCTLIAGGWIGKARAVANAGIGVLGDPLRGNRRVNSLVYGASGTYPAFAVGITAGIEGRTGPQEPGLEPRAVARAGVVRVQGRARVELDATLGLTGRDGNLGFAVKTAFNFHAFSP